MRKMEKSSSIVVVDKRNYRAIAQENWGLTREQMKGMHVHHRTPRSEGGTNDAANLYVCSPSFHRLVWHEGEFFIEQASEGGRTSGSNNVKQKLGIHSEEWLGSDERLEANAKGGRESGRANARLGKGICAPGMATKGGKIGGASNATNKTGFCSPEWLNSEECSKQRRANGLVSGTKNASDKKGFCSPEWLNSEECLEQRKRNGVKTASLLNSEKWRCVVTGKVSTAGPLTRYQKKRGIDPSLRVKVEVNIQDVQR